MPAPVSTLILIDQVAYQFGSLWVIVDLEHRLAGVAVTARHQNKALCLMVNKNDVAGAAVASG